MDTTIRARKSSSKSTEPTAPARWPKAGQSGSLAVSDMQAVSQEGGDRLATAQVDFDKVYRAEPMERIEMIKRGVPAAQAVELAARMGISKEQLFRTLGLARATIDRKVREVGLLSPDESSRVLGLNRLIGRVQALVEDAGPVLDFNAARWTAIWLEQQLPALGSRRPAELMDTAEGQEIVFHLIDQIASGAYA